MSLLQNDPTESLEVFDAAGRPTGIARSRSAIHVNGDWHQAFHCWIVRRAGNEIVLQWRSPHKDTFGGLWDATAAGHWRFGETAEQAAREIDEELGIHVPFEMLEYRGRQTSERSFTNGLIDREHHQVYVWHSDMDLDAYRPDSSEVVGLAAFPARELIDVLAGDRPSVTAVEAIEVAADGTTRPTQVVAGRPEFVPHSPERLKGMLGWVEALD